MTFAERLMAERGKYSQSPEGIALLLKIDLQEYLELEGGKVPSEPMLKKLCALFNWNFLEYKHYLLSHANKEVLISQASKKGMVHFNSFLEATPSSQPSSSQLPSSVSRDKKSNTGQISQLCEKIKQESRYLSLEETQYLQIQLDLIARTVHVFRSS